MTSALEEEMAELVAKEMQKAIDKEVLWSTLEETGWTWVTLERYINDLEIISWLEENCTGEYSHVGRDFIFKHKKDAVSFILKWK